MGSGEAVLSAGRLVNWTADRVAHVPQFDFMDNRNQQLRIPLPYTVYVCGAARRPGFEIEPASENPGARSKNVTTLRTQQFCKRTEQFCSSKVSETAFGI